MRKILIIALSIFCVSALYAERITFRGTDATDKECYLSVDVQNGKVVSVDGKGYGKECGLDIFGTQNGLYNCTDKDILTTTFDGYNLADAGTLSEYNPEFSKGFFGTVRVKGTRSNPDSKDFLKVFIGENEAKFSLTVKTGLELGVIPVPLMIANKTFSCYKNR